MSETKNKKRKRSFMQQMKRMNERGNQGKGQQLSREIYTYYMTVYNDLKKAEKENRAFLIKRIIRELVEEKKAKLLASNQLGSRILDDILPETPTKFVFPVIDAFSEDLRPLCVDQFSSHVLQTLLIVAFRNIQQGAMEIMEDFEKVPVPIDEESKTNFVSFLLKVSKFVYNNLEDFIQEKYASYIVRTVLEICSGVEISSSANEGKKLKTSHSLKENATQVLEVPESLTSLWLEILERIKHLSNFEELILCDCGSATLQTVLLTLDGQKDTERIISLASHIIEYGFMKLKNESSEVHPVFESHPSCRLMEVLVTVVPKKNQKVIYGAFFRDKMSELVDHEIGWHAVEKLFASLKAKDLFSSMLTDHVDCLGQAFLCGRFKILVSIVQSCRRLNVCQDSIIQIIAEIFESSYEGNDFAGPILYFLKLKEYEEKKEKGLPSCSLYGAYILEEMLKFPTSPKVVFSILNMSSSELVKMASDPRGSHVIDAFVNGPNVIFVPKLYEKLQGNYVALSCSKHGSYSVEHIFNYLDLKLKTKLCEELLKSSNRLKENRCGTIIYNKFQLQHFTENEGKNWKEIHEKISTKQNFLEKMRKEGEELDGIAAKDELSSPLKKKKKRK